MSARTSLVCTLLVACGGSDPAAMQPAVDGAADGHGSVALAGTRELCKLLSNRNPSDPTANDVQHRANVLGADLGIPVVHDGTFYLMFGDTIGVRAIWGDGESHPDSVGYGLDAAAAIAADPQLLCARLGIVTLPPAQSLGPSVDPAIVADFAGVAMTPPAGHALDEFIKNPSGPSGQTFANLPGDFEVPSGAFAYGDSIYVFYTTVVGPGTIDMKASYLARWQAPSKTGPPSYQILYGVDQRFDASGALHGDFINIAAQVAGEYVYLFGTGDYRRSKIHVARKRLDTLATPGGFEELGAITDVAGYGETSVRYFPALGRWMLLAEELTPASNRIVARFGDSPTGPWDAPIIVHDMADPAFRGAYCCATENDCIGEQFFHCDRTGFYGTYLFPDAIVTAGGFTVTYTMSSFSPYNVALFQATFAD